MALPPLLLLLPVLAGPPLPGPVAPTIPLQERVVRRVAVMGTLASIETEAEDRIRALAASEAAVQALEAVEDRLSTWDEDSELARLNRTPAGQPFDVSPELERDLAWAEALRRRTDGLFDPGIGRLVELWGLREGGRVPAEGDVRALLGVGLAQLELVGRTAIRRDPRLSIEEGAFGKGLGLDSAIRAASLAGARRAVIDLGGQVALLPGGAPCSIALAHPRERERALLSVRIDRGSLSTSGNSERGFTIEGTRHGHILDPRTGRPAADFGSLSVWAGDAATADALSTALYVLGPSAALAWADAHEGVEALALVVTPEGVQALASAGLRDRVESIEGDLDVRVSTPDPATGIQRDN